MLMQPTQPHHKRSQSGLTSTNTSARMTVMSLAQGVPRVVANAQIGKMTQQGTIRTQTGKGSIMFQKAPIKIEGDLSMHRDASKETNRGVVRHVKSKSFNLIGIPSQKLHTPLTARKVEQSGRLSFNRYETPNSSKKGARGTVISKSPNSSRGFGSSFLKPSDASLLSEKSFGKGNNSFVLPKKEFYNLRGLINSNKPKLKQDISFNKSNSLNRTGFSSKGDNKITTRSVTPLHNKNKTPTSGNSSKLSSNFNLRYGDSSKSPNRSVKNSIGIASNVGTQKNKIPFDSSSIKSEIKSSKNIPIIFSSYAKKILNTKAMLNSGVKIKSNQNKTITVHQNVSQSDHTSGDVSTNSTFPSKVDKFSPSSNQINKVCEDKRAAATKDTTQNSNIDFRAITTSPLLRNKPVDSQIHPPNPEQTQKGNTHCIKKIKSTHHFSQVGYSGYGVKKVNQDNFFIFQNFVGNSNHVYFSVCDGHGINGHEVSSYLKDNLPITLHSKLKLKNKNILLHNINSIIEDAFLEINYKLHSSNYVDTTFSGSTCVSLIYTPEKIISANVGDSRAVIGRCDKGVWTSHDLTRDHKPSEKDEAMRIKKKGGRIQPFRDEEDEFVGPPRVWLKEEEIPGLAMTRAFGDRVASTVGVIAEPEIKEYKFTENDRFMIIASDGVWEFIESEECVNIIKEFYLKNDIVGCCEYIHKESSKRWMKEEEVIDDITMIIVFFE